MRSSKEAGDNSAQCGDQLVDIVYSVGESGAADHHDNPEEEENGCESGDYCGCDKDSLLSIATHTDAKSSPTEVDNRDTMIGAVDRHHESQNQDQCRVQRGSVTFYDLVHPAPKRASDRGNSVDRDVEGCVGRFHNPISTK
jgi:hypothetical protein